MAALALLGALVSGTAASRALHGHVSRAFVALAPPPARAAARAAALPPPAPLGSPLEYCDKLEESMRRGEWRLGLSLYEQCESTYGACMSSVSHAALVTAAVNGLLRAGRLQLASSLLLATLLREGARSGGLGAALEPGATNALLDACASTPGHMREAQAIVRALVAANATVDAKTYCILIKGFGRNEDARGVSATLRSMRAAGVEPDIITCNAALDAYARARAPEEARALLRAMEGQAAVAGGAATGIGHAQRLPTPNARSFNTMIKAFAIVGRVEEARALAERMGAAPAARAGALGSGAQRLAAGAAPPARAAAVPAVARAEAASPVADGGGAQRAAPRYDQITLNTLIDAYARAGELDTALSLLLPHGASAAADGTASGAPTADGNGGGGSRAALGGGSRGAGAGAAAGGGVVRAGAHAYTSVIVALTKQRRLGDALLLFAGMEQAGVPATAVSYNCLIAACARAGDDARAHELFEQMRRRGGELAPDVQTYNALISGLCRSAHVRADALQRVLDLVRQMEAKGLAADARTYNALLGALARRGDGRAAAAIAARMEAAGISLTTHSHTALLAAHGGAGDLASVAASWRALLASGLTVDLTAWREYMRACLRADARNSEAGSGAARGARSGKGGVEGGAASTGAELALAALDEMRRGAGESAPPVSPDAITYAILIHGLSRTRSGAAQAWRLYQRMRAEAIALDEPCARALMIACKRFVGVEAAAQLLVDLKRDGWSERALEPLEKELRNIEAVARYTVDERWKAAAAQAEAEARAQDDARREALGEARGANARLRYGGNGRAKPRQRDELFERHGWNEFDGGFRML